MFVIFQHPFVRQLNLEKIKKFTCCLESIAASKQREEYFDLHVQDSIKGATLELQGKYDYVVSKTDVIVAAAAVALQAAQAGPAAVTVRFSPMPPKSVATGCALTPPR